MILLSIQLHPYAGITDKTYFFDSGLTAICGPNEDGKSTVAKAIQQVLFLEPNLTPAKKRDYLKDVMPLAGSDTICVSLKFLWNGYKFTLEKKWGATPSVKLIRSDGITTTDSSAVQQKIQEMLPANQAVIEQILIASQSKLADAVSKLSEDVQSSLSEKLRAAILNGGGISGTRLEQTINQEVNSYFGRWDDVTNSPEGGSSRGLSNPWRNGVGFITDAWYKWEQAKADENETLHYETESNRLQTEINACNEELSRLNKFLEEQRAPYQSVNQRIFIDGELLKYQTALDAFAADAKRWPNAIAEKENTERFLDTTKSELSEIEKELNHARQKQAAQQDLIKLTHVNSLITKKEEAEKALLRLPDIPDEDIRMAQQYHREIDRCKSLITGQRLNLLISPKVSGEIHTVHSGGQNETINFVKGQIVEKEISGGIQFDWHGVSFIIQSANEDISSLENSLSSAEKAFNTLLDKHSQPTIDSLINVAKQYKDAQQQVQHANSNLLSALNNDTIESLTLRCETAIALPSTRELDVLENLEKDKNKLIGSQQTKLDSLDREIAVLVDKHKTFENLDERRLKGRQAISEKENELAKLPPLPDGYGSADEFQKYYSKIEEKKHRKIEAKHQLENAIKDLKVPQHSLSEAKEQRTIAEARFYQTIEEGQAYRRMQQALQNILALADANAFLPLHTKVEAYLSQLSSGRFHRIPFDITQPQKLEGDGVALPISLLSKGTKDILALALRLAAAEVYLENHSGFVIMDDPLVDMDRKRREASAAVLRQFAETHQTIIFTCHENHAALLHNEQAEKEILKH